MVERAAGHGDEISVIAGRDLDVPDGYVVAVSITTPADHFLKPPSRSVEFPDDLEPRGTAELSYRALVEGRDGGPEPLGAEQRRGHEDHDGFVQTGSPR